MVEKNIEKFKHGIRDGKHVFVLFYMNGCGPCNDTKPKWYAFEERNGNKNSKNSKNSDIIITDLEMNDLDSMNDIIGEQPSGFPTMRYYKGSSFEDYDECAELSKKDRSIDSFEEWLHAKTHKKNNHNMIHNGGKSKSKTNKTNKTNKKTKMNRTKKYYKRGGKWSLKYKKSINCRHPKGFSQRQHCKYGRKNWKT